MTTLIGWPTTLHTDVKATSFWRHFLGVIYTTHEERHKNDLIFLSFLVKESREQNLSIHRFSLKNVFTLDTPKVKLLWNVFQILCHHPCWIICLKSVALDKFFMAFVLASLWYGHVFFPVPQNLFDQCHLLVMISKFMLVFKFIYLN